MKFKDTSSWNEFDWEKELRKDDASLAAYIAELPKYIDLPGEDSILLKTIKRRLGTDRDEEDWAPVPYEDSEQSGEYPFPANTRWKETPGGAVFHNSSVLARDLLMGAASANKEENRLRIMRILTLYGQLMARSADLIDMSLEVERAVAAHEPCDVPDQLRLAIIKRLLSYQNKVTAELQLLREESSSLKNHAEAHLDAVGMMHDHLVDLLNGMRESLKKGNDDDPFFDDDDDSIFPF